jgi:hypothetical protein
MTATSAPAGEYLAAPDTPARSRTARDPAQWPTVLKLMRSQLWRR